MNQPIEQNFKFDNFLFTVLLYTSNWCAQRDSNPRQFLSFDHII